VAIFTSQPLGKEKLLSIGKDAEWSPEPVSTRWWRERSPCPCREWNKVRCPAYSLIIILTGLSQLLLKYCSQLVSC